MTYPCRLIPDPELNDYGNVDVAKREVGDMWFVAAADMTHLSDYYKQHNTWREPLVVLLPGRHYFLIDGMCYSQERGYYGGWTVTGTPPNITVAPSINMVGRYHGFLQNGVLTENQ